MVKKKMCGLKKLSKKERICNYMGLNQLMGVDYSGRAVKGKVPETRKKFGIYKCWQHWQYWLSSYAIDKLKTASREFRED